jgi:hypothetical protein
MNYELFPELGFGENENLSSNKLNQILLINEMTRRFAGPFSISKVVATGADYQPKISGYWLRLDDNITLVGHFITTTPRVSTRFFTVYYNDGSAETSGIGRWDEQRFYSSTIEGTSGWYTRLGTTGFDTLLSVLGTGTLQLNLSNANISSFSMYRYSG